MTPLEEVAANQEERIESNIIDMKEAFYDREPDLKIVSDSQSQINKKPLYYRFIKRAFDVVFSLIVIVITFIPMLILSVFVAIDTKAFPIYSQERVGHKGPFKFFKMRSMVRDSDDLKKYFTPEQIEQWNKEHKVDSDPRITVLGSFLRRTSMASVIIGTPGDGESTKSLPRSANSSLDLRLCERRPGLCSASGSYYKPFEFLSVGGFRATLRALKRAVLISCSAFGECCMRIVSFVKRWLPLSRSEVIV